jgi:hypothetical protein
MLCNCFIVSWRVFYADPNDCPDLDERLNPLRFFVGGILGAAMELVVVFMIHAAI